MSIKDVENDWRPSSKLAVWFLIPPVIFHSAYAVVVVGSRLEGWTQFISTGLAVAWMWAGNRFAYPRWRRAWLAKMNAPPKAEQNPTKGTR